MLLLYPFTLVIFTLILVVQNEELTPSCKKEVSNACTLVTCGPVENGLPGKDGKVGPKGEKGDSGLPGLRGLPGLTGNTGPIGPKGDKGSPGDPSPKGDAGKKRLPGVQGLPGSPGSKGSPVPQGEKGSQGEQGPKGEDGAKGPAGSPGPAGNRGPRGPSGPKGDRGSSGKERECCLEKTNKLKQEVAELHANIENLQKQFSEQQKIALFPSGRAIGKKIFKTSGFKGNFDEAMKTCKTPGGIVASPRNKAENKAVQEIVSTYKELAFLGMTDIKTEGKFIYPTGEPLGYSNWNSGEPNNKGGGENCIEIFSDGKWNDKPCEEPHLLICEFSLEEM